MVPIWLMIAQGAKALANNENSQINSLNRGSNNMNTNNNGGIGNALSTFSSIYGNYLKDGYNDKKKLFMR